MILGVCGYGFTGSGAVIGLLKEYGEPQVFSDAEIQEAFRVDGLQDLEYHLVKQYSRHMSGDAAILRFKNSRGFYSTPVVKKTIGKKEYFRISEEYISGLVQGEWYGIDNMDYFTKNPLYNFIVLTLKKIWFPFFEKLTGKPYNHWPARKMYLSIEPENFYEKTKQYTDALMSAMGADLKKDIVLDQLFEANAPSNSFPFFRDPKAIVVDRDPRDVYLLSKVGHKTSAETRFMPRNDVKVFVEYYRRMRKNKENNSQVLYLQFEDLIYNYEQTVSVIEKYTGYSDHAEPKKYFDPAVSIHNTQIFNNPKYEKFQNEILFIETELKDYLFPFEEYKKLEEYKKAF